MCSECHTTPCHPRCPNSPEPPIYAECENCGEDIYDGDEFYEIGEHKFCEACVNGGYKTAYVD